MHAAGGCTLVQMRQDRLAGSDNDLEWRAEEDPVPEPRAEEDLLEEAVVAALEPGDDPTLPEEALPPSRRGGHRFGLCQTTCPCRQTLRGERAEVFLELQWQTLVLQSGLLLLHHKARGAVCISKHKAGSSDQPSAGHTFVAPCRVLLPHQGAGLSRAPGVRALEEWRASLSLHI